MEMENRVTFQWDRFLDPVYCATAQTFDKIMVVWVDRNKVLARGRGWLTGPDTAVT